MAQIACRINNSQIISVIDTMLSYVDPRLVKHGQRVAYIVSEMMKHSDELQGIDKKKLIILSILHDIGAYKTEEIDEMVLFESKAVWSHSVYGYLFLKYMSPLRETAEAIFYHHLIYSDFDKANSEYLNYAAIIHLADRVDLVSKAQKPDLSRIINNSGVLFAPEYVELFMNSEPEEILKRLRDGTYSEEMPEIIKGLSFSQEEALEYLKMIVFSVDFRSEYTVTHTINTTAISTELGRRMGLSQEILEKLYMGALLHDVGKIAISPDILEFQGRLTYDQMKIMKQHVVYTKKIINGVVDDEIVEIASRHHEKNDGSGYPDGLFDEELTLPQQIIAVADIVSALTSKRSYKEEFSKERTINILAQMSDNGQVSSEVCQVMIDDYDDIMDKTDDSRNPIIKTYENMHKEYVLLNNKVQALLKG